MSLDALLRQVRSCTHCTAHLPFPPNPVLRAHPSARLLIIGQAPGTRVHESGIPWDDPSGDRLRSWLDLSRKVFYDERNVAIIPMGFCYPGKGKSGDLPPQPECAPLWHSKLHAYLPNIALTLLIGQYAQHYYLRDTCKETLTDTVKAWKTYGKDGFFPLVHPSPRNQHWLKQNPWFEKDVVPELQRKISKLLERK